MPKTLEDVAQELGVDTEHIVSFNNQFFIKYKGLLSLAHKKNTFIGFDEGIVVHIDTKTKNCIYSVKALFQKDETHITRFTAIGHSSPENISSNGRANEYEKYYVVIAETRAKARALRDALNIPLTSFEELGEGIKELVHPNGSSTHSNGATPPQKISDAQKKLINNLADKIDKGDKMVRKALSQLNVETIDDLNTKQASSIIEALNKKMSSQRNGDAN